MHFNLEHYGIALENYHRALDSCFKSLPKDHNYFAQIYDNIGLVYKLANDEATAIQYFEKSFEIRSKNLLSNHPSITVIRNMLDEARKKLKESK
jgi:tetratricopeptide (TPR) repeat protein